MKHLMLVVSLSLLSQASFAVDCKNGNTVRKVEVVYETEGKKVPCSVKYTKEDGSEKTLFTAKGEEGFCEKKSTEFMEKIKSMGWECAAN